MFTTCLFPIPTSLPRLKWKFLKVRGFELTAVSLPHGTVPGVHDVPTWYLWDAWNEDKMGDTMLSIYHVPKHCKGEGRQLLIPRWALPGPGATETHKFTSGPAGCLQFLGQAGLGHSVWSKLPQESVKPEMLAAVTLLTWPWRIEAIPTGT